MDAVKFLEERKRMCCTYDKCGDCPLENETCGGVLNVNAESLVGAVEEWSTAHPRKTRQSVFLEQYPEARVGEDGVLRICPCTVSASHRNAYGGCTITNCDCDDCHKEYWLQEVK